MSQLLPCPFCPDGGRPIHSLQDDVVYCAECCATTVNRERWNKRSAPSGARAEENTAQRSAACDHTFESNPGLWDSNHRYCSKCGIIESKTGEATVDASPARETHSTSTQRQDPRAPAPSGEAAARECSVVSPTCPLCGDERAYPGMIDTERRASDGVQFVQTKCRHEFHDWPGAYAPRGLPSFSVDGPDGPPSPAPGAAREWTSEQREAAQRIMSIESQTPFGMDATPHVCAEIARVAHHFLDATKMVLPASSEITRAGLFEAISLGERNWHASGSMSEADRRAMIADAVLAILKPAAARESGT